MRIIKQISENSVSNWIVSLRPRTLVLSQLCVIFSTCLAYDEGHFDIITFILTLITSGILQILSNLANDYGDALSGVDSEHRKGPLRMVSSKSISTQSMKRAITFVVFVAVISGAALILYSLKDKQELIVFFMLGVLAIFAAIKYSAGRKPYGHFALGDISVFIFFGWVGVLGVFYLQARTLSWDLYLPATACGLLAAAVLNINNIRDLDSDIAAGKITIAGKLGFKLSKVYHSSLIVSAICCLCLYVYKRDASLIEWVFLLSTPILALNAFDVFRQSSQGNFDLLIKQLMSASFITVILLSVGIIA